MSAIKAGRSSIWAEGSANRADGARKMSIVYEASLLMREAAKPYAAGDKAKHAIQRACDRVSAELRAAKFAAMEYGRARRIWKQEARRIDGFELDALRRAAERAKQAAILDAIKRECAERQARNHVLGQEIHAEFRKAMAQLASLRARLASTDSQMFSDEIDRLGNAIGTLGSRLAPAPGPLMPRSDDGGAP